jgi:regulator of sigma E protease
MSIVIFLIILAILILAHEFGHFLVAKRAGIRADEFGIGFPPRIWGKKFGETIYSINWIPFGGFVRIFGEDPSDEATSGPDSSRSFINKPSFTKAAVLGAGVAMNLFMGWLLLAVSFMSSSPSFADMIVETPHASTQTIIMGVEEGSPAGLAGLSKGDLVLGLGRSDGSNRLSEISPVSISNFILRSEGQPLNIAVERDEKLMELSVTPTEGIVEGRPAVGIMTGLSATALAPHVAVFEAAKASFELSGLFIVSLFDFVADAITGRADFTQITGPVGIVAIGSETVGLGFFYLISFAALISINLAVINLLPIPALDGGRLFFLAIETIKRKPLSPKMVNTLNAAGFAILIILMLAVTWNDIAMRISF